MEVGYHKFWSRNLNQDMELKTYGNKGKPVLVFPSSGGRFYEYEDFGMVEACRPFIEAGSIQLFTVDSVDKQSWYNYDAHPADRARRHNDYDRYIVEEAVPFIQRSTGSSERLLATGCSLGAYHSANFFFRHPDVFDTLVALSGLYSLKFSVGEYMDDNVYFNSPLAYLPNLTDPWYLDRFRENRLVVCAGQGPWEEDVLVDTYALKEVLERKGVPCWVDIWGHDVAHDWPWWKKQMPYFLSSLGFNEWGQA